MPHELVIHPERICAKPMVFEGTASPAEFPHLAESLASEEGELRFTYDPPKDFEASSAAMYGWSRYRMPIPCTVSLEFALAPRSDVEGARRVLWMTASPIDLETWVKVLPKWRRSRGALARFGFPLPEGEES